MCQVSGVAAVGDVPLEPGGLDKSGAAGGGRAGGIDRHLWERFHNVWSVPAHPFSRFWVNKTHPCSMPLSFPWYCASLVM
ncbi:hypothetical protein GCM10022379_55690 [Micromonospora maritima]